MEQHGQVTGKVARMLYMAAACLFMLFSPGCAYYGVKDSPLSQWTPEDKDAIAAKVKGDRSTELLVLVAFSGGGTRAASFAYGVLQELAETEVTTANTTRPLLEEIDMISSVSGGSFTSAYYGLYGDRIFDDFEERFLRKDVEGHLLWKLARPVNWFRLASSTYGRADMAAKYYDEILFNNTTFADMNRPDAPEIIINSTDLATGVRFSFVWPFFAIICSDLDQYPVSRAVTASSSVPGLFTPITLENFAGSCGFEPPAWLEEAKNDEETTNRKLEALVIGKYVDRKNQPWLHLVDGGLSDNLGLRSYINLFDLTGNLQTTLKGIGHADARQILIISVDSHTKAKTEWAKKRRHPSLRQVLGSVSSVQISRYSIDTKWIAQNAFIKWTEELTRAGHPITFHFVDVSFDQVESEDERNRLNKIGTNFSLSDKEVDLLITSARKVVRQSPALQDFLRERKQMK